MSTLRIKLDGTLDGVAITPRTLPVNDLIQILKMFQHAVGLQAEAATPDRAESLGPTPSRDLSLVGVEGGSDTLVLGYDVTAEAGVDQIMDALSGDDLSTLNVRAKRSLTSAFAGFMNRGGTVQFINGRSTRVFSKESPIRAAKMEVSVEPSASIFCRVESLGRTGTEGKKRGFASVFAYATGQMLNVKMPVGLAEAMSGAGCVFSDVTLEGEAKWRVKPRKLASFKASSFIKLSAEPLDEVFRGLAAAMGGHFDGVDPVEYANRTRQHDAN